MHLFEVRDNGGLEVFEVMIFSEERGEIGGDRVDKLIELSVLIVTDDVAILIKIGQI